MDYTEDAIAARISGRPRLSRQIRPRDDRISLLIDIQNNIKAQQSAGYAHWAKLNNLKQAARTINFLTEHGIQSYGMLEDILEGLSEKMHVANDEIKAIDQRMGELELVRKYAAAYRQLKPIYDSYRRSHDKEKFLRGHESDVILFEASARELRKLGAVPIPTAEKIEQELAVLVQQKRERSAELYAARKNTKEYETIKNNVDMLLSTPRESAERQHGHELE